MFTSHNSTNCKCETQLKWPPKWVNINYMGQSPWLVILLWVHYRFMTPLDPSLAPSVLCLYVLPEWALNPSHFYLQDISICLLAILAHLLSSCEPFPHAHPSNKGLDIFVTTQQSLTKFPTNNGGTSPFLLIFSSPEIFWLCGRWEMGFHFFNWHLPDS